MKILQKVSALILTAAIILLCSGCLGNTEKGKIQDFPKYDVLSSSFGLTENEILTKMGWEESQLVKLDAHGGLVTVPMEIELAGKRFQTTYFFGYDEFTLADVFLHSACSDDPETAAEEMVAVLRTIVPIVGKDITKESEYSGLSIDAKDLADVLTAGRRDYRDHVYEFDLSDMAEESLKKYAQQLEQSKAYEPFQGWYELFYRLELKFYRDEQADSGNKYWIEIRLGFERRGIQ